MIIDPVCKMEIPEENIKVQHKGKTYYFCSSKCADAFKNSPDKFAR